MIITEYVEMTITGQNIKYYKNKGYDIPQYINKKGKLKHIIGANILVKVIDLPEHSTKIITYICDICKKEETVRYCKLTQTKTFKEKGLMVCFDCYNKTVRPIYKDKQYRVYKYQSSVRKRDYSFELNLDEFLNIVNRPCFYCGDFSNNKNPTFPGRNGIDRIDNNIGYTLKNCVPCCDMCNRMKMKYSYDDFLKHIEKIYNYKIIEKEEQYAKR